MEDSGVIELLRKRVEGSSQKELAEDIGVSQQYINDLIHGRRTPSDKILKYLGLKREIVKVK